MAARNCPHCGTEIPFGMVAAFSNGIDCPKCKARLELGPGARTLSSACGLVAGAIVWRISKNSSGYLAGVLPTLYAFLAFGIVSPLVLMFTASLQNAPVVEVPEAAAGAGHGSGGHGSAHH